MRVFVNLDDRDPFHFLRLPALLLASLLAVRAKCVILWLLLLLELLPLSFLGARLPGLILCVDIITFIETGVQLLDIDLVIVIVASGLLRRIILRILLLQIWYILRVLAIESEDIWLSPWQLSPRLKFLLDLLRLQGLLLLVFRLHAFFDCSEHNDLMIDVAFLRCVHLFELLLKVLFRMLGVVAIFVAAGAARPVAFLVIMTGTMTVIIFWPMVLHFLIINILLFLDKFVVRFLNHLNVLIRVVTVTGPRRVRLRATFAQQGAFVQWSIERILWIDHLTLFVSYCWL